MLHRCSSLALLRLCAAAVLVGVCCAQTNSDALTRLQRTVVVDQKAVNDAVTAVNTAGQAVTKATERRTHDFEHSVAYHDAQKAVADKLTAVEAARKAALAGLQVSPAWREGSAKRAAARARADALKTSADGVALNEALREADRLDAVINALEDGAIQSDATYKAARDALLAAAAALKSARDTFSSGAAADPQLTTLRKAREAAEQKLTQAQAKLQLDRARLQAAAILGE